MYSLEEGRLAVWVARGAIEDLVASRRDRKPPWELPPSFRKKAGVFVTINTYPTRELRGCIGYPEPVLPLMEALVDAARSAASRDPRFEPLEPEELGRVVVEVSLLTPPEPIEVKEPREYLKAIRIGRDGLIVDDGLSRGLLLPQVPVEWGWGVHEFLDHTCMKAGLPASAWMERGVRILRFTAEIFDEKEPRGEVVARPLSPRDELAGGGEDPGARQGGSGRGSRVSPGGG
ncbi:MAG: TIGR00296 family protein [Thermoplasmatota archaeon]